MPTCIRCGKIDANLRDGVCGDCLGAEATPTGPITAGSKAGADANRSLPCAPPSRFICYGLTLQVAGGLLTGSVSEGMRRGSSLILLVALLMGFVVLIAGSILLSVGIIRWAIWPLIERRDG